MFKNKINIFFFVLPFLGLIKYRSFNWLCVQNNFIVIIIESIESEQLLNSFEEI